MWVKSGQPNNINGKDNSFSKPNKELWFSKAGDSKHVCTACWFLGHKHPEFSESPITALLIFLKCIHYIESLVSYHCSLDITFWIAVILNKPHSKLSSWEPKVLHFRFPYSIITPLHACYNTLLNPSCLTLWLHTWLAFRSKCLLKYKCPDLTCVVNWHYTELAKTPRKYERNMNRGCSLLIKKPPPPVRPGISLTLFSCLTWKW